MPGTINETWFKAEKTGTYRGQCAELCGRGHGFMPIVVEVLEQDEFDAWVAGLTAPPEPEPEELEAPEAVVSQTAAAAAGGASSR